MAEDKEGYWSKHHTGIIQCAIGAYCAIFATWTYFHPRDIPAVNQSTTPQTGASMTSSYSMPLGLFIGIIALVLSVVVPAVIRIIKNWRKPNDSLTILSAYYGIRDIREEDVLKAVRGIPKDALVIPVENN